MGYIYKITNTVSGKCYIGETAKDDPEIRWNQHKATIRRGVGCPALRDAVNKYGIENFKFEVLVICFDDARFEMERLYIKKFKSQVPNGYNISAGGMGGSFTGKKHTPKTIERIVETTRLYRQNNPDWFEKYREKHREVMSKVDTGSAVRNSEKFQLAKAEGRVGRRGWKNKVVKDKVVKDKVVKDKTISSSFVDKINKLKLYYLEITEKYNKLITDIKQENKINKPIKQKSNQTDETKEKIRDSVNKYYAEGGYINIEKQQEAMAKASGIKVNKYDLNGIMLGTYNSISEAARQNNLIKSTLLNRIAKNIVVDGISWRKIST